MVYIIITMDVFLYIKEKDSITQDSVKAIQNSVTQVKETMELKLYILDRVSFSIAANRGIFELLSGETGGKSPRLEEILYKNMEKEDLINTVLISEMSAWKDISGIYIYSLDGKVYYRSKKVSFVKEYDYREENWFKEIYKGDKIRDYVVSNYDSHRVLNSEPVISVVRKIFNIDTGLLVGYVKIDMDQKKIVDGILKKPLLDEESSFGLYNSNGDKLLGDLEGIQSYPFNDTTSKREDTYELNAKSIKAILPVDKTSWQLIYNFTLSKISQEMKRVYFTHGLLLIGSVLVALLISYLVSLRMSRDIKVLKSAMELAELGDLNARSQVKTRDEIGALSESFNTMIDNIRQLYDKLYKSEIETIEAQISALQAQINPHFLYNTLECIDALALSDGNEVIGEIIRALIDSFEYAFKGGKTSTLEEELKHVKNYVDIIMIRYPDKMDVSIEVEESFLGLQLPRLTLQPIVENAILHGVLKRRQKGHILIKAYAELEQLILEVSDNGVGIDKEKLRHINSQFKQTDRDEKKNNIGLLNVNNRIKYFYGNDFGLTISCDDLTSVKITLPNS